MQHTTSIHSLLDAFLEENDITTERSQAAGDLILAQDKNDALKIDAFLREHHAPEAMLNNVAYLGDAVFEDGAYHGPRETIYPVFVLGGWEVGYYCSSSQDDCWVGDCLEEALHSYVIHHPERVRAALHDKPTGNFINDEERDPFLMNATSTDDFTFIADHEVGPAIAWCRRPGQHEVGATYTDSDKIFPIIDGDHAGKFLRVYSSRLQGSADYKASLLDRDEVERLVKNTRYWDSDDL